VLLTPYDEKRPDPTLFFEESHFSFSFLISQLSLKSKEIEKFSRRVVVDNLVVYVSW